MLQTLEVAYGPQTAVVWLNRPDVRNALDPRMIAELTETFMCGSLDTRLISHFGSTSCKALYRCVACREPFDYFKPH